MHARGLNIEAGSGIAMAAALRHSLNLNDMREPVNISMKKIFPDGGYAGEW
jgi:hypothetical protein